MPRLLGIVAAVGLAISCGQQGPTASAGHQSPTATASAGHQSPAASPGPTGSATPPSPGDCASQSHPANFAYSGSPASSITVCPGRAAAGAVVHITLQGCNIPSRPPAALVFLGPSSWIGSGGAGNPVPFKTAGGDRYTATFTIPATYVGGETGASPNPTLPVRPGDHYAFATYPAGICDVPFTVTSGPAQVNTGLRSRAAAPPPAVVTAALWGIGQCLPAKPVSHQVWWARVTNRVWSRLSHGGPPGDFPLYVAEISGDFACPSNFRGTFHTRLLTVTVPVNGTRANPARFECGIDTGEIYPVRKLPGAQVFTPGRQQASSPAPRTC